MVDMLREQLNCEIYPVHRLDTTTTGIMVFAKTEQSAGVLSKEIANRQFKKEYLTICHGCVDKAGEMRDFLYHDRIRNKSFVVKNKRSGSKEAILEYELLNYNEKDNLSLVKVKLHTGRTHQIRVHCAYLGHPIIGDTVYGGGKTPFEKSNSSLLDGQILHAKELSFPHPKTGEMMHFECELPNNFKELLNRLEKLS